MATGSISGICQSAFVDGEASTSNALRQAFPKTLKFRNPEIDPLRPRSRQSLPIHTGWNAIRWEFGKLRADFLK
jgi:hypothetical protein